MKYKILIVDDEPANLRMLDRLFRENYDVVTAESGPDALEALAQHDAAVIISDQRMPQMTGIEFLQRAAEMRPQTVRIVLTGYTDVNDLVTAINSGVIYKYITKPWVNADLMQTVSRAVEHYDATKHHHLLAQENQRLIERIDTNVDRLVHAVCEVLSQKNYSLAQHCRRVANYAREIAGEMGLCERDITRLTHAALLHELPNTRMPFDLAFNSAALTDEQHRVTRLAYERALQIVVDVPDLEDTGRIIRYQHEHFDGSGFFDRLSGEAIPLLSRVLAVANAFDELHAGRNPALLCTDEEAADWLRKQSGTLFDPEVVEACLSAGIAISTDLFGSVERSRLTAHSDLTSHHAVAGLL